jgi:hypothetical protein
MIKKETMWKRKYSLSAKNENLLGIPCTLKRLNHGDLIHSYISGSYRAFQSVKTAHLPEDYHWAHWEHGV